MQSLTQGKHLITIFNKIDNKVVEPKLVGAGLHTVYISAKLKQNITALEEAIYDAAVIPEINENSVIITSARHYEALTHADESILRVIEHLILDLVATLLVRTYASVFINLLISQVARLPHMKYLEISSSTFVLVSKGLR